MRPLLFVLFASALAAAPKPQHPEILWDHYGVPHIFAASREDMFYAHGWAQMRGQSHLLLRLYGESRARAAEYWGGDQNRKLDHWLLTNNLPTLASQWYNAQSPEFRRYLDAFAQGINDYAARNPTDIAPDLKIVLPVTGLDVAQHSLRIVHFMYMGSEDRLNGELQPLLKPDPDSRPGSNTWSVGPTHSASGNSMLVINPHLLWGPTFYRYMEIHITAPGYDFYGAPQIGFPVGVVGFNRHTGWGRTVNTLDNVDFYRITPKGAGYLYDGAEKPYERRQQSMKVRQADGTLREETFEVLRTVHGPVVYNRNGVVIAMRVAGLDRPRMLEQWYRMSDAANLDQFKDALRIGAVPMWNANYADDQGHIMLVDNGLIARRPAGDWNFWNKVVPGDTSKLLWNEYLKFEELPRSEDPASGWNQNTNEPPWTMTFPQLDRTRYPAYVAPAGDSQLEMRTLRSLGILSRSGKMTFEQLVAAKHDTGVELADRILPDLLPALAPGSEARRVLAAWDRHTDADSRGAVLFEMFVNRYMPGGRMAPKMRIPFDPRRPLETATGLKDPAEAAAALEAAAVECRKTYGSLDIPWGDVHRYAAGNADVPGNGGTGSMGIFRTMRYSEPKNNRVFAVHGETFVCVIEFAKNQRAQCALSYGNSSQPGSKHQEDQLPLIANKKLHDVLRDRPAIERDLELREQLSR